MFFACKYAFTVCKSARMSKQGFFFLNQHKYQITQNFYVDFIAISNRLLKMLQKNYGDYRQFLGFLCNTFSEQFYVKLVKIKIDPI